MVDRRTTRSAALVLLTLLLLPGPSPAATIERFSRTSGFGGFGAGETTTTVSFSGPRRREVSSTRVTGALGGFMNQYGGGDVAADIVTDAAAGTVRRLDHRRKTFTETPLVPPSAPPVPAGAPPGGKVISSRFEVLPTGDAKTIAGFPCTRTRVAWMVETEDGETRDRTIGTLTMDVWSTPETKATRALREREASFADAWRRRLGIDPAEADIQRFGLGAVAGLLGGGDRLRDGVREFSSRMQKLPGFPVAHAVTWKTRGAAGAKESTLFESYTEARRIDPSEVAASAWEIPAGYTRVEAGRP